MVTYTISHKTTYTYQDFVSKCYNAGWLVPVPFPGIQVLGYHIEISPTPNNLEIENDFFGNKVIRFDIQEPLKKLIVHAGSEIRVTRNMRQDVRLLFESLSYGEAIERLKNPVEEHLFARQFTLESPFIYFHQEMYAYFRNFFTPEKSLFESLSSLTQRIYEDFEFKSGYTTVSTPVETVFKYRKGVCQDFAHLMITGLRMCGLAARYVSGYIETIPPPGKEKLVGTDASHAWVSVYFPEVGWLEFDPTNNCIPGFQHIPIAYGRDYSDVPPLKGVVYGSGNQHLEVSVDVKRSGT